MSGFFRCIPLFMILASCASAEITDAQGNTALQAERTEWASLEIPHASVVYYDIAGSTAEELRAQMDAFGPVGYDGYHGDATTRWVIRWNWPGFGLEACDLQQADVTYIIEVTLPRWKPPEGVDRALLDQWDFHLKALIIHEKGHVDYVVGHIPRIISAIHHATCETADATAAGILEDIRDHDRQYDDDTDHGRGQGAQFP
jgi:predicted secreted Zn-dependent protease